MSVLSLRELSAEVPAHASLLDLFQQCREHVVAVAATHLLPDIIAVTTRGGFIEIINTVTGAFHLYLTFLNQIPLDAALRCFSLVPGLVAASSPDLTHAQQYLAYSLAYSNELLVAHVEAGTVRPLTSLTTRPSCVYCDGDYIACGEGCGQISVWRISTESGAPALLWHEALFEDAVITLRIHRDVLICCSADCSTLICDVDSGVVLSRLVQESDQAVCALPLTKPLVHHAVVAMCFPRRLSVYQSRSEASLPAASGAWLYQGGLSLDREVQCATSFGGYLAAGTASGVVMLFACDAVRGTVEEVVRFDVGFAVVAVQLYASETLLVVTTAGDVWRWPLADLLPGSAHDAEAAAEAEAPPEANTSIPRPTTPPVAAAAAQQPSASSSSSPSSGSASSSAVVGDGKVAGSRTGPRTSPALVEPASRAPESGSSCPDTKALSSVPEVSTKEDHHYGDDHNVDKRGESDDDGDEEAPRAATEGNRTIVMEVSFDDAEEDEEKDRTAEATDAEDEDDVDAARTPPNGPGVVSHDVNATKRTFNDDGDVDSRAALACTDEASDDNTAAASSSAAASAALAAFEHKIGPVRAIDGLRRGPRMDPRRVMSVLHSAAVRADGEAEVHEQAVVCDRGASDAIASGTAAGSAPAVALQSTEMLAAYRDALLSQHVSEMDLDAYAAAHRLEAEALLYQYPVRQPRYTLQDRVFDDVQPPRRVPAIESGDGHADDRRVLSAMDANAMPVAGMGARQLKALADVKDDLVDVTFGRVTYKQDPALVAERERGGPSLTAHCCESVLRVPRARPADAVLFDPMRHDQVRPRAPMVLPLPLPATPSAF